VVIDGAGHQPWVERPETVRRLIRDFLGMERRPIV